MITELYYKYFPYYYLLTLKDTLGLLYKSNEPEIHLKETINWLCTAQDATPDNGVARSFITKYNRWFKTKGWVDSYPETTGYIIPTFWDYYKYSGIQDVKERAIRMTDWACEIQQSDGWIQGGIISDKPTPAVFNTGQVLFGYVKSYQNTNNKKFLDAAIKAGNFLGTSQDEDGAWRRNISNYASESGRIYKTMVAWSLAELYTITNNENYKESSIKNLDFAIKNQNDKGWFKDNCLTNAQYPLLHTIAYAIQGLLESGIIFDEKKYIEAAIKPSDYLIEKIQDNGLMPARYRDNWSSYDSWSCLTGSAQMSNIWLTLFKITGNNKYSNSAKKVLEFIRKTQNIKSTNSGIRGGIKGAYPFNKQYGKYEFLNWAAKFYADALLKEIAIDIK